MNYRDIDTGFLESRSVLENTGDTLAAFFAKPGVDEESGFGFFLGESRDDVVLEKFDVCLHALAHRS